MKLLEIPRPRRSSHKLRNLREVIIKLELKVSKERIKNDTGEEAEDFSQPSRFPD